MVRIRKPNDFDSVITDQTASLPHPTVPAGSPSPVEFGTAIERKPLSDRDDGDGKPVGINKFIGRRPVFASGNSDGDLPMLQYTMAGSGKRFALYLHHTDSVREWAYDRESHIGKLDKGLDAAAENNWAVIDMKNDWKVIYPFELSNN